MSAKRKSNPTKKSKAKSRKVEYDDEDISSEHDSEVEHDEQRNQDGPSADGEADAEEDLADLTSIPELPAPEVSIQRYLLYFFYSAHFFYR